jgi:hypothetical protein
MKYIENKLSLDGVFFNDIFLKHSTPVYKMMALDVTSLTLLHAVR